MNTETASVDTLDPVEIDLGQRSYPIYIGADLLEHAQYLTGHLGNRQVMIVTNDTIDPLYSNVLERQLGEYTVRKVVLPDGEQHKNLDTLNLIFDALLSAGFDRNCTLVALGGGVVGDMTGFAAASYQRGVNFIQIPTTLLAQVDSSVGGKTGVNHEQGKNMIGAFLQPRCVIADINTLTTLPDRELRAGLAEVIKYGFIVDAGFFGWLHNNMNALLAREPQALSHAIRRSCEIKADVVASDEHERGIRAILNLGHTFGHAIEAATGYTKWLHGEAVAAGTAMAMDLSVRLGWLSEKQRKQGIGILQAIGLPTEVPAGMSPQQFLDYMQRDKKTRDGKIRLVLLKDLGTAVITSDFDQDKLHQTLQVFCDRANG